MVNSYIQALKDSLKEETDGASKYAALSKEAPTEEAKKKLMEIAKQEVMHRAMLECLLMESGEQIVSK